MKKIPLTKGRHALVDDEDYPYLSRFNWQWREANGTIQVALVYVHYLKGKQLQIPIGMHKFLKPQTGGQKMHHINGNLLDFRKDNLIYIGNSLHAHKGKKTKSKTTSKYKGVCYVKDPRYANKWLATIDKDKQTYYLGRFDTQ